MILVRNLVVGLALASLTACGPRAVQDRPIAVKVPVAQPCALPRPAEVSPLAARADWDDLDVRQKAALVGKQALELRTYGEQLNAATGACK